MSKMITDEKKDELKNRISIALKDSELQLGFEIICNNLSKLEKDVAQFNKVYKDFNFDSEHFSLICDSLAFYYEHIYQLLNYYLTGKEPVSKDYFIKLYNKCLECNDLCCRFGIDVPFYNYSELKNRINSLEFSCK